MVLWPGRQREQTADRPKVFPHNVRYQSDSDRIADVPRLPVCAKTCREQVQQTAALFDHLVSTGEQSRWNCEAERLGRLEVDDEL